MIINLQLKFYTIIINCIIVWSSLRREVKSIIKNILNTIRIGKGLSKFNKLVFRASNSGGCNPDY